MRSSQAMRCAVLVVSPYSETETLRAASDTHDISRIVANGSEGRDDGIADLEFTAPQTKMIIHKCYLSSINTL